MKYAIVDGQRREAVRGLKGTCEVCEVAVTPRCGRFRVPHWSHPPATVDHRWEPETEWHRRWKDFFPKECQEVCHRAENGERHLADVKTAHGQVLEFQHSAISEEERSSREAIYQPMCWVANGLRLKNDRQKFFEALRLGLVLQPNPLTIAVPTASCLLLRKWENSQRLVVFDFGEIIDASDPVPFEAPVLWTSRPGRQKGETVLMPIYSDRFLDAMIKGKDLIGVKGVMPAVRVPIPPHTGMPSRPKHKGYGARKRWAWSGKGTGARRSGRR